MLELPPDFVRTVQNTFGEDGKHWLESLPALLDESARRWDLTDIRPVPNLSYNFVAFARTLRPRYAPLTCACSTGVGREAGEVVLKLGVPNRELTGEIAALRCFDGRGAIRLLDADAEKGMLLLERLQLGRMLAALEDDVRATELAADVMKQLWQPVSENTEGFIQLKDWFEGFKRLRRRYHGKTGPLPEKLVETAEALSRDLLAENKDETLLHGDFHHYNVLESARGWLAIDPKGVTGPKGYEVGPLLINPVPEFLNSSNPKAWTEKRIAILAERLGMERERIHDWGTCHAALSAWWGLEDNDPDGVEYSLRCAELFLQIKT